MALAAAAACGGGSAVPAVASADTGSAPASFAVTIDVSGTGTIGGPAAACSGHCVWQVHAGALHLAASAGAGWQFQGWSALCTAPACDVTVSGAISLTATFIQPTPTPPPAPLPPQPGTHRLSVTIEGSGRVVSTPAGIDCTASCSAAFPENTEVVISATPAPGMLLKGFDVWCPLADQCPTLVGTFDAGAVDRRHARLRPRRGREGAEAALRRHRARALHLRRRRRELGGVQGRRLPLGGGARRAGAGPRRRSRAGDPRPGHLDRG